MLLFIFSNKLSKGGSCEKMGNCPCLHCSRCSSRRICLYKYKQMEKFLTEYNLKDIDVQAPDGAYNGM